MNFQLCFQIERNKLLRERQLREQAEKEKEELEQQLRHFQEEARLAHEALVSKIYSALLFPLALSLIVTAEPKSGHSLLYIQYGVKIKY